VPPRPANRFDAASHRYYAGSVELVSVTTLLERDGQLDSWWFTEESRDRGQWVHARTAEFDLTGESGDLSRHEEWAGYVRAYESFRRLVPCRFDLVEVPLYRPDLGLAGTPDRGGLVYGRETVLDLKTGGPLEWHGRQLALYDILRGQLPPGTRQRIGLYLSTTGKFKIKPYTLTSDYREAERLLSGLRRTA